MTIEALKKEYPKLFTKLPDDIDELRHLLVLDVNYNDDDTDAFDDIDPNDYNYLLYITQRLQETIGEEGIVALIKKLNEHENFQDFYPSQIDLYGIKSTLDEEGVYKTVLGSLEGIV